MSEKRFLGRPFGLLGVVCVMGVTILVVGERWRGTHEPPQLQRLPAPQATLDDVLAARRPFHPTATAVAAEHRAESGVKPRTLNAVYALRHYPGAPPCIPHDLDPDIARDMACNVCHEKGGYVQKYNAYAPLTPHPEFSNCMQCHVERTTESLFQSSDFAAAAPPALNRAVLPGGPPPIPHTLQLRENCLACHSGPAAPLEIRTSHPERINCRQCHVPVDAELLPAHGRVEPDLAGWTP